MKMNFNRAHLIAQRGSLFFVLILSLILASCASPPEPVQVGEKAPDFQLQAADDGEVSLSDYRGRQPVLLYFHMADG